MSAPVALDGLSILTRRLPAGARVPWHDHGRPTLCVVQSGLIAEEDASGTRERQPGDLIFRAEPLSHRNQAMAASEVLVVEMTPAAFGQLRALGLPAHGAHFVRSGRTVVLARQLRSLLARQAAEQRLELLGRLLELMGELVRDQAAQQRRPPHWLLRVRDRLHESCSELPDLADLMREAPVAPITAARLFRSHFGDSVTEFALRRRIEEASRLLVDTDLPLVEVALATGFCDQSHLTRTLRRQLGVTPGELRRRSRFAAASPVEDGTG